MSRAWLAAGLILGTGSLLVFALPPPERWALQPNGPVWQLLTAGLAHWNALHLAGNLAGLALIALLGQRADLGTREALAWLLAGPLAHALLRLQPDLPTYAGLSGWLHAGVVAVALALLRQTGRPRWIGVGIGIGLLLKLLLEQPWGPLLRPGDWWGGATLPLAHGCGALAGLLLGGISLGSRRARPPARSAG